MKKQTYPKEDDKANTIKKLRAENRLLLKKNKLLREEIKDIKRHIKKNFKIYKSSDVKFDLSEIVDAVNNQEKTQKKVEDLMPRCPQCGSLMDSLSIPAGVVNICTGCDHRYVSKD